jgi:hypothetical protein
MGVDDRRSGAAVRGQRRAAVEAEPADPQQHRARASSAGRVRQQRWTGKALPLAEQQRDTSAETPAVVWTTMPPAKSSTPACASQPPPHTQCATGA